MSFMDVWNVLCYGLLALIAYLALVVWEIGPSPALFLSALRIKNKRLNQRLPFRMWKPPIGDALEMIKDYARFFHKRMTDGERFGGTIFWSANQLLLLVHDPRIVNQLLSMDDLTFARNFSPFYVASRVAGKSIITSDGEEWRMQHRILYKAFSPANLVAFRETFAFRANCILSKLTPFISTGNFIDIEPVLGEATLAVVIDCAFGQSLGRNDREHLVQLFKYVALETTNPLHLLPIIKHFPGSGRYTFDANLKRLHDIAEKAIKNRKMPSLSGRDCLYQRLNSASAIMLGEDPSDGETTPEVLVRSSLVDLMIEAAQDNPEFTDEKVRDNALLFLTAGSETTSTAMTWLLYLLTQHPNVYKRVMAENEQVDLETLLLPGDLSKKVPYLTKVIQETLRLRTPVGGIVARICTHDTVIGDLSVPKGAGFTASSYDMHHHPCYWDEPERFNPDRFAATKSNLAYLPFGGGRRYCIGKLMAIAEMQVMLSYILRNIRFNFAGRAEDTAMAYRPPLMQPKNGMKMKILPVKLD
eukprot:gene2197-5209_t